jgi:hypothetical protein
MRVAVSLQVPSGFRTAEPRTDLSLPVTDNESDTENAGGVPSIDEGCPLPRLMMDELLAIQGAVAPMSYSKLN